MWISSDVGCSNRWKGMSTIWSVWSTSSGVEEWGNRWKRREVKGHSYNFARRGTVWQTIIERKCHMSCFDWWTSMARQCLSCHPLLDCCLISSCSITSRVDLVSQNTFKAKDATSFRILTQAESRMFRANRWVPCGTLLKKIKNLSFFFFVFFKTNFKNYKNIMGKCKNNLRAWKNYKKICQT